MLAILILLLVACTKISNGQPPTNSSLPAVETAPSKPMPIPVLLGDYSLLSPDDMRADLDYLFQKLEAAHPNLYMNRPKIEVDADRQRVYAELAQPATIINYYLKVAPLIASLGDRHTFVLLPSNAIGPQELFFPLVVEFHEKRAFIVQNFSGVTSIQTGAELLFINSIPISSIQNDLTRLGFDHDGVSYSMWYLYGSLPEYQLEIISPGEATSVDYTVPGMTSEAIWKVASSIDYPRLNYVTLPGEKIGLMTINTFRGGPGQLLAPAFTQIQNDNIQNLIIDIRSNQGGNLDQVDTLMKYLTNQPYRHCSVRFARYVVDISSPPREIECVLMEPLDIPLRYKGKLYLLIGPDTFSAAITLATILQDYNLAVLIGEETRDKASYCGYTSDPQSLTRTHLLYQCPADCFVRPSGISDNHGVIPDVIVETIFQDRLAGVDLALAKALELIHSSKPTP